MPRDLGKAHVMLEHPELHAEGGRRRQPFWQTKVVVGKPATATPIISETMKYITVNPTWNVPPSIVQQRISAGAAAGSRPCSSRMGLKVAYNRDGSIHIYQPPGDGNALGRIRFNFPNKFLVYQHDTPDKHLFAHDKRAYSHGCMRVENPFKYGEVLLSLVLPKENYTQERLRRMFGNSEQNIQFPTHIPVHITYQTAFVDDRQAADARGHLRPRQPHARRAQGRGAPLRRHCGRAARDDDLAAGTHERSAPTGPTAAAPWGGASSTGCSASRASRPISRPTNGGKGLDYLGLFFAILHR